MSCSNLYRNTNFLVPLGRISSQKQISGCVLYVSAGDAPAQSFDYKSSDVVVAQEQEAKRVGCSPDELAILKFSLCSVFRFGDNIRKWLKIQAAARTLH